LSSNILKKINFFQINFKKEKKDIWKKLFAKMI